MKSLALVPLLLMYTFHCFSQKPPLDTSVFDKWPSVDDPAISNNGRYVIYTISNQPVHSSTLVIQSTAHPEKSLQITHATAGAAQFTGNSNMVIFKNKHDSLGMISLPDMTINYIPQVRGFKLFMQDKDELLAYQLNDSANELIIHQLMTGKQSVFKHVDDYQTSKDGHILVLLIQNDTDEKGLQAVQYINLKDSSNIGIWQGKGAGNLTLDDSASQLAFTTEQKEEERTIWYYKKGANHATKLADDNSACRIDTTLTLGGIDAFTKDGSKLFITLREKERPAASEDAVQVDIYSYKDKKLQSQQLVETEPESYLAVIKISDQRIIRIQQKNETGGLFASAKKDKNVCVMHREGDWVEWNWLPAAQAKFFVVSTNDGSRRQLPINVPTISLGGRYVTGRDTTFKNIYTYDLTTGKTYNITRNIPVPHEASDCDDPLCKNRSPLDIAAWMQDDSAVLVYCGDGIWQLDPRGEKPPLHLTDGYEYRYNTRFWLAEKHNNKPIATGQRLILIAFNHTTKRNGFYAVTAGSKEAPQLLSEDDCIYNLPAHKSLPPGIAPLKARDTTLYLVQRSTTKQSPNYFYTADFKTFTPLSNVYPEQRYNWMTTELLTWQQTDGRQVQGVLYKPENFDSTKKYPAIIHYYEKRSDELNMYQPPRATDGLINIPWFVSRGYLVLTPDIYFTIGEPGESALNAVVSAADHLATFSWADAHKMGIQGHSLSGYITNYIVTHSDRFAAAVASAGPSDFVSNYGAILAAGYSAQFFAEYHSYRIGATLWQRPDLYIKNSPIFQADKVNTPLLLMHNKKDGIVPFAQGMEFFTALRRLDKKAWLLQYDDSQHGLQGKSAIDYTVRMTQFFDHYLKGSPAPNWMTTGIPARLKGIINGLQPDSTGATP